MNSPFDFDLKTRKLLIFYGEASCFNSIRKFYDFRGWNSCTVQLKFVRKHSLVKKTI